MAATHKSPADSAPPVRTAHSAHLREEPAQARHRAPSVRIVLLAIVAALIVVSAVGYLFRDKIYDPEHSYGTPSPHVMPSAGTAPAGR